MEAIKFEVNVGVLLEAFNNVKSALAGVHSKIYILRTVFCKVENGKLVVRAYDLNLMIERSIGVSNASEGEFCMEPFMFKALAVKYDSDTNILVSQKTKNKKLLNVLEVSCEGKSNDFTFINAKDYPEKANLSYKAFDMRTFIEALTLTKVSVGSPKLSPTFMCFSLNISERYIITGDGSRFCKFGDINMAGEDTMVNGNVIKNQMAVLNILAKASDVVGILGDWSGFKSETLGIETMFRAWNGQPNTFNDLLIRIDNTIEENGGLLCEIEVDLIDLKNLLNVFLLYETEASKVDGNRFTKMSISETNIEFGADIKSLSNNIDSVVLKSFEGKPYTCNVMVGKMLDILKEFSDYIETKNIEDFNGHISEVEIRPSIIMQFYAEGQPFFIKNPQYPSFRYLQVI